MKFPGRLLSILALALVVNLFGFLKVATGTSITIDSGANIKTELFRAGTAIAPITFSFAITTAPTGDGVFDLFAGGDLNNILDDTITVTSGATTLGVLNFPVSGCNATPVPSGTVCPIPETVPGGAFQNLALTPVGDVQGQSAGIPGLIVPQNLLVAGTNFTVTLSPSSTIFDLYIDRLQLSYPGGASVPEPVSLLLLGVGIAGIGLGRKFV